MVQIGGVKWRRCFGEAVQQCVNSALGSSAVTELSETLSKCRSVVDYFEQSAVVQQLQRSQQQLGVTVKRLKLDCVDRYNSTVRTPHHTVYLLTFIIMIFIAVNSLQYLNGITDCHTGDNKLIVAYVFNVLSPTLNPTMYCSIA